MNSGLAVTWRYLPSQINPAYVASRGCYGSDLVSHPLWWGPEWLKSDPNIWPTNLVEPISDLSGMRKSAVLTHAAVMGTDISIIDRFSSLDKVQSVMAYILRFVGKGRNKSVAGNLNLTVSERKLALSVLIKMVQSAVFADEIELLRKGSSCSMV